MPFESKKKPADQPLTEKVFIAGIDVDGQLRGKFVPKAKASTGTIPFCSVVFGWDCNDDQYQDQGSVADADSGFGDLDLHLDWDRVYNLYDPSGALDYSAIILGFFAPEKSNELLYTCPRSLLRKVLESSEYTAKAGAEIEFYNFEEDSHRIADESPSSLKSLTTGMHGYSALRPVQQARHWTAILKASSNYGIEFDTFHSETGPGVFECALKYQDAALIADQVSLFKYATRLCGEGKITPCFMAKPKTGMPGNSGHLHCSLWKGDSPVFAAKEPTDFFPETNYLSEEGHYFLGGLLEALPDIMLMFAPNVNSYKRLDPAFWAPVTVTWGVDNRLSSIRLIDAFEDSKSVRFEVRIPGADMIPHFALAAIYGAGYRGIAKKIKPTMGPVRTKADILASDLLPCDLSASIKRFEAPGSLARELFGDQFVNHYAGTRKHELAAYNKQVGEWEFKRYIETS